jgi:hypothetical protein
MVRFAPLAFVVAGRGPVRLNWVNLQPARGASMDFLPLVYSLIGGIIVALVNHFLTQRKELFIKRELYREIIYREKIAAYKDIHSLACAFIHKIDFAPKGFPIEYLAKALEALAVVHKAIDDRGLFMTRKVSGTLRFYEELTDYLVTVPGVAKERYQLDFDPGKDVIKLLAGKDECIAIREVLKKDLGINILTKDLGKFFGTKALKKNRKAFRKKQGENEIENDDGDGHHHQGV